MRIKIIDLKTNEIEELEVSGFSENGYTMKAGKGISGISINTNEFKIEQIE